MKKKCYVCGEELEVNDKCTEVVCADCLIAGPPLYRKDGIDYYSKEAFSKLLGEYKPEIEIWETAQKMRDQGLSLRAIGKRLECSHEAVREHTVNSNV